MTPLESNFLVPGGSLLVLVALPVVLLVLVGIVAMVWSGARARRIALDHQRRV